jgi:hypothetical protein
VDLETLGLEWRPVPGFAGYSVSDAGTIRADRPPLRGQQLKLQPNRRGYLYVQAWDRQRPRKLWVHHACLLAFVGPRPSPKHEGRHLNGNNRDNRPANLAWGTRQDNVDDQRRHDKILTGERAPTAKLTVAQVAEIRSRYRAGGITQRSLAELYGVDHMSIGRIVRGETYRAALASAPAEEGKQ